VLVDQVYFVTTPCGTPACRCESAPSVYGPGTGVGGATFGTAVARAVGAEFCPGAFIAVGGAEVCGLGSALDAAAFCARAPKGFSATIGTETSSEIRIGNRSLVILSFHPRRFYLSAANMAPIHTVRSGGLQASMVLRSAALDADESCVP
jgi:hypothetical protein